MSTLASGHWRSGRDGGRGYRHAGAADTGHTNESRHPGFDITNADTWPEMLTVEELALILRSSTKAVREMIANGQIEALRGAGRGFPSQSGG